MVALDKLTRKGADLVVANDVSAAGVGFEHDTNAVTILGRNRPDTTVGLTDKRAVANAVLDAVLQVRSEPNPTNQESIK